MPLYAKRFVGYLQWQSIDWSVMRSSIFLGVFSALFIQQATTFAAEIPQASDAFNARVRNTVLSRWKIPFMERSTTVRVKATVGTDGKLTNAEFTLSPTPTDNDKIRKSVEEVIASTSIVPAESGSVSVEFKMLGQVGPYLFSCFPLKIYVPSQFADSPGSTIPDTSVQGMTQGIMRWNRALSERSGGKITDPITAVSKPEMADVRIDAYEDMPPYGAYLTDNATGQVILRVALKRPIAGAIQSGYRLWQPLQVTQQTMFQIGRIVSLSPTTEANNVLLPMVATAKLKPSTEASGTKDVQVSLADGGGYTTSGNGLGANSSDLGSGIKADYTDSTIEERTIKPEQLDQVLTQIATRPCRR